MKNKPLFIIGSGRSGSTLLRMMLSAHSAFSIPPETWFISSLVKELPVAGVLSELEVNRAISMITGHYRWADMEIDSDSFREEVFNLNEPTLRSILELIYNKFLIRENARRWGDKTPPYISIVPEIIHIFNDAQFIYLVRDGRDVSKSFHDRKWMGNWLYQNVGEWIEAVDLYESYTEMEFSNRILEVRYEDLVSNPKQTLERICDHLGESFEPSMLDWSSDIASKIPGREQKIHKKLMRSPSIKDIDRWKTEASLWEKLVLNAFIGKYLQKSGYEQTFRSPIATLTVVPTILICKVFFPIVDISQKVFNKARKLMQ
ncbi:MAG: sulfotransferase [Sedimenticola sp.]